MNPALRTDRLIIRLARPGDAEAIAAYYTADATHMRQYSPPSLEMLDEAYWRLQIDRIKQEYDAGLSVRTFLFEHDDRTIVGAANLSAIIRGVFQACFLGYTISESHEGRGLMYEALQALIGYAFDELNLHRIMANYQPSNRRSAALLERLGFKIEGTAKGYLFINGAWQDHVMTAKTNDAWREP